MEVDEADTIDNKPHFENSRGERLYCKYWKPILKKRKTPRALVLIVHGYAEHCGYYDVLAEPLTEQGCLCFSHDHVGHGQSDGSPAFISDFNVYRDDAIQHMEIVRKKYPRSPLFIVGHSMGGFITIQILLERPDLVAGAAFIGPLVTPHPDSAKPWMVSAARWLAWLWPECPVTKLDSDFICKDANVVQKYDTDPLVYHGYVKAGWAVAGLNAMAEVQPRLHEVRCPILVIHGDEDRLCMVEGAKMLHMLASTDDKTLNIYEGAYHQVHYEPDGVGEKCISEICQWIEARI